MPQEQTIMVYGNINPPSKYWRRHATTYLEWEIPSRLEGKLSKLIEQELKAFHKNCECPSCKKDRK